MQEKRPVTHTNASHTQMIQGTPEPNYAETLSFYLIKKLKLLLETTLRPYCTHSLPKNLMFNLF